MYLYIYTHESISLSIYIYIYIRISIYLYISLPLCIYIYIYIYIHTYIHTYIVDLGSLPARVQLPLHVLVGAPHVGLGPSRRRTRPPAWGVFALAAIVYDRACLVI